MKDATQEDLIAAKFRMAGVSARFMFEFDVASLDKYITEYVFDYQCCLILTFDVVGSLLLRPEVEKLTVSPR